MKNRLIGLAASLCAAALLAACATGGGSGGAKTPEKRAVERWKAIIAGDYATAYTYLTPGYRSGVSEAAWTGRQSRLPARRTGVELEGTECESIEVCEVRLNVEFEVQKVLPGVDTMTSNNFVAEAWLLLDGQWYFAPDYR